MYVNCVIFCSSGVAKLSVIDMNDASDLCYPTCEYFSPVGLSLQCRAVSVTTGRLTFCFGLMWRAFSCQPHADWLKVNVAFCASSSGWLKVNLAFCPSCSDWQKVNLAFCPSCSDWLKVNLPTCPVVWRALLDVSATGCDVQYSSPVNVEG